MLEENCKVQADWKSFSPVEGHTEDYAVYV